MSGLAQRVANSSCPFSQAIEVARGRSHTKRNHRSASVTIVRCQAKGTNARRRPQLAFEQPPQGTPAIKVGDSNNVEHSDQHAHRILYDEVFSTDKGHSQLCAYSDLLPMQTW